MDWDWIGVVSTAAVGVAGIAATVIVQRAERKNSLAIGREARSQGRRQATYERLLKQAVEVTEFVGNADVIFVRNVEPPDVDVKSYDAWLVLDLYASEQFALAYRNWQDAVADVRDILDEVPAKKAWFEVRGKLPDRFRKAKAIMDDALVNAIMVARAELG
jgi:hypothetical protein